MRLKLAGKAWANNIRVVDAERSAPATYQEGFPMTRQLVAASLAVLMLAAPAVALAADPAPTAADSSAPAKKTSTHKHKSKKAKKEAAPAAQ
jgi:hypothetical protein